MPFASHDLFLSAFSAASGLLSIAEKEARAELGGRLRPPVTSTILASLEECLDLIVISQERDEQVRWPVLKDKTERSIAATLE